jgi:hypothetical protein
MLRCGTAPRIQPCRGQRGRRLQIAESDALESEGLLQVCPLALKRAQIAALNLRLYVHPALVELQLQVQFRLGIGL